MTVGLLGSKYLHVLRKIYIMYSSSFTSERGLTSFLCHQYCPSFEKHFKMQTLASVCAFLASCIFCSNHLLIKIYSLHSTDLLLVRSLIQVILCGFLARNQRLQILANEQNYWKDISLLILQVSFLFCIFQCFDD